MRRLYRVLLLLSLCIGLPSIVQAQVARSDYNANGSVDFPDFLAFSQAFGTDNALFDYDSSGSVDFPDFLEFAGAFGQSYTKSETPNVLSGNITSNTVLTAGADHLLSGAVFVQDGATLVVMPGVTVFGEGATNGTLIIAQGGKIIADGTKDNPIVFTSDQLEGQRDRGQWGGLIINGRAPINTGSIAFGEGDTGQYGGTDANDSSGILRYVRVEFAGIEFSPDNELNGIAFQGVGSGTVVDYVQVHFNQDDGIEFFGGTVNAKHLYVTGIRDDSFDWTDGWTGKGQFWVAQQRGDDADNGIEADNEGDNNEATPRSNPTIYNITLVGDPDGPESDTGMLLREGTAATIRNAIVIGFNSGGLDIDQSSTFNQANSGALSVQNTIFYDNRTDQGDVKIAGNFNLDDDGFDDPSWATTASFNNSEIDPLLTAPYSQRAPDYRPDAGSPATNGIVPVATPPSDDFFEAVDYIGAFGAANWIESWTTAEQPTGSSLEPTKPSNVVATVQSGTSIRLSWNASTDATSYTVQRRWPGYQSYTTVATGVTATNYTASGLIPGTQYTYRVVAANTAGSSAPSTAVTATTTASGTASGSPVVLAGNITTSQTLTANNFYLLSGAVFVQDGVTLSIEPGTQIFGEGATNGTLIVAQGGKIIANGTEAKPIVFTSDQLEGQRDRGQWGGLIINGRAPINTGSVAFGEGDTGQYGGTDATDSSGILRYVRVEFAGIEFSPDNELNGIAFQGVGSGTVVDYVQVHFNQDDGIEFFGGTVNAKHLYVTGIRDDSFDWTDGWTGKGQFWVAQQRGDDADNGIEADNEGDNNEATPRSNPTIYNITLVGDPDGPESDTGMLLREGTAATIRNAIVVGFNSAGLDIDQSSTFNQANSGALSVQSTIFFNNRTDQGDTKIAGNFNLDDDGFDEATWATTGSFNNSESDPMLTSPYSQRSPDYRPMSGSIATNGMVTVSSPPGDGFFEPVTYIGAVDPNNNWLANWTTTEQPAGSVFEPDAPSAPSVTSNSTTSVSVSWAAVSGATSYTVQRTLTGLNAYTTVAESVSGTSYTDENLVPGSQYTYRIVAVNAAGSSSASTSTIGSTLSSGTPSGTPEILTGDISSNMTLIANKYYLLRGAVFVVDGVTLTIEPGTQIFGEGATNGTLIVSQGAKIIANGTASKPIVFTSDQLEGQRDRGQWGGLIINGRAPINTGSVAFGEGDTGQYGGTDATDSSGILRYVRVEFAGIEFSPDNELNGIAFQGVGSGTVVDYVQVHFNQDDGIEFFGGTVNAKHLYVTGIRDDSFDWTDGWTGKGQFWVAQQRGDDADNGIEADNEGDNNEATPRSNPTIYNITLVGDPDGPESDTGMLLREGTAATIRNAIVVGFNSAGLDIDQSSTFNQANSGALSVQNSIFYNNRTDQGDTKIAGNFNLDDDGFDETTWATSLSFNNSEQNPSLAAPYSQRAPDYRPMASSIALNGTVPVATPPSDGFFDTVDYIGAVGPNSNWLSGWTTTEQPAGSDAVGTVETLSGNITASRTLTADKSYLLSGAVFVKEGATLTIEAGTQIFGEGATNGTLIIEQGAKINASGTASKPIVFTSDQLEGQRDRGQWGGLIINGRAPINTGSVAFGEGDTGQYGGTDPLDNSGVLRYVRVEFAGIEFSPDNELNGIAFQGVGSGTVVEYVQVHYNQDDGVEFFGGTVNAKYIYCSGIRDDSFDWTDGWTGKGQFWIAQHRGDDADNGIEADNEGDNNEATPRSNPTIYNITLVGDPNGPESDTGMLLREGTAATIRNAIVIGFNSGGLDIDQSSTFNQANSGALSVQNTIFFNNRTDQGDTKIVGNFNLDDDSFDEAAWATTASFNNAQSDPLLMAPYSHTLPDYTPSTLSPAANGTVTVATPPSDGFFSPVTFVGAMGPNNNWLAGWITTEMPKGQ